MNPSRRLWLAVTCLALLLPGLASPSINQLAESIHSTTWTNRYDQHFRKYAKRYFGPSVHWHWFKSQGIAESGLRERVTSKAGAIGIMQILPATFAEIQEKSPYLSKGTLSEPRWNIAAGIFYDRLLHKRWQERHQRISHPESLQLAFASYNAGYRRMLNVLANADYTDDDEELYWSDIEPYAPTQTQHYVRRIRGLMGLGS